jgi:hypothetical protein
MTLTVQEGWQNSLSSSGIWRPVALCEKLKDTPL